MGALQRGTRRNSLVLSDFAGRILEAQARSHYAGPRTDDQRTRVADVGIGYEPALTATRRTGILYAEHDRKNPRLEAAIEHDAVRCARSAPGIGCREHRNPRFPCPPQ